jgi:hypothetical protein
VVPCPAVRCSGVDAGEIGTPTTPTRLPSRGSSACRAMSSRLSCRIRTSMLLCRRGISGWRGMVTRVWIVTPMGPSRRGWLRGRSRIFCRRGIGRGGSSGGSIL